MLEQQLKKLGFSENEALVYAVLLKNSPASATHIANKCNMSRSSVYTVLSALTAKGLVGTTYRNEVKQFIAEGYPALEQGLSKEKTELEKKFTLLEGLKANLDMLSRDDVSIPQILFFEGQDGLKRIYASMLRQAPKNSTMYLLRDEFVWQKDWSFIFGEEWHERVNRLKTEKNILTKLLVNPSKIEKDKEDYYKARKNLEFKYLPADRPVKQFALYLLGDIVSIMSMENNNLIGIQITNRMLAENMTQVFEVLWKKG